MARRTQVSRLVPTRTISSRRTRRPITQTRSFSKILKEQKTQQQIIEDIKDNVSSFAGSITNVNDANSKLNSYFQQNINQIPPEYISVFKSELTKQRNNLMNQQNELISDLQRKAKVYSERQQFYQSEVDRPEVADKYDFLLRQTNNLLSQAKSGSIFDLDSSFKPILREASNIQRTKQLKLSNIKTTQTTQREINSFIKKTASKNKVNSLETIKKELKVSDKVARKIREIQRENLQIGVIVGKEKISKKLNDFIPLVKDNFYLRFVKTNASFPENIQNARKIFLGELSSREIKKYNSLNNAEKRRIINYAILKNISNLLPKISEINSDPKLDNKEVKQLKSLALKSESELFEFSKNINPNKFINSYNSFIEDKEIKIKGSFVDSKTGKTINTYSYISKVPETKRTLKNVFGLAEDIDKLRQRVLFSARKRDYAKVGASRIFRQIRDRVFILGGIGLVKGVVSVPLAILSPIKTIKSQIQAVKSPIKTLRALGNELVVDPVGTVAQYYTFSKTLNLGTKAVKRSPVGRFVQEELFIKAQPKELRPFVREIIKSSKIQEKINPYKIKSIKKVNFAEVKSLNSIEAKALAKTLGETDSVVFGSVASRTLSKGKTPIPKDVDLATASISRFNNKFINNLPKKIRSDYVLKGEKIFKVSTKQAILDVKPLKRLYPDKSILSKKGYLPVQGYVYDLGGKLAKKLGIKQKIPKRLKQAGLEIPTQKIQKVGKIKLAGFGEQTARKGLGTLQALLEKNIKRAKDPSSFIKSLEVQIDALKLSKPKTPLGKLSVNSKIKRLSTSVKILKSKSFENALRKKVGNIINEYPILKKISVKKLSQATKKIKSTPATVKKYNIPKSQRKIAQQKATNIIKKPTLKSAKTSFSYLPKSLKASTFSYLPLRIRKTVSSLLPSSIPASSIPISRLPLSKIPSKIPSKMISKVPSKLPSKVPKKLISKLPISKTPSKIPSKTPSVVPSKTPSKIPSKIPSIIPSKLPSFIPAKLPTKLKVPPKIKLSLKDWTSKLPTGYSRIVNVLIRASGQIREIPLKTTPNRALSKIAKLVDNSTVRSFSLKIIGIKRVKDISSPNLKKFRKKISKGTKVLPIVEKSKYAIDTRGEKKGLKISKLLKLTKGKSNVINTRKSSKRNVRKKKTTKKSSKRKKKK